MPEKPFKSERRDTEGVDLETQFILRLPEEPAAVLREAIQSGNSIKERLFISLENDLRRGMVRLDNSYLYAKVMDLPTTVEAMKTIDKKSFYKTADISQVLICKEEPFGDPVTGELESPQKNKKKDPNKVDKKYLYPHGITPSLKNVRKRRFRKTLKKKNVELPEIEKEVKRLLRVDNEAVNVKWEIVECEDVEPEKESGRDTPKGKKGAAAKGKASKAAISKNIPVDEHHIFGEEVSDSEEEDINVSRELDLEDTRLSDDSRSQFNEDSNSMIQNMSASNSRMMTEFKSNMFDDQAGPSTSSQHLDEESIDFIESRELNDSTSEIRRELHSLRNQQSKIEQQIQTIDNKKLKERMQDDLDNLMDSIYAKQMELDEIAMNV